MLPRLNGVLALNDPLRNRARDVFYTYLPLIGAIVKQEPVKISETALKEIDDFLNSFSRQGDEDLRTIIRALRNDLVNPVTLSEYGISIKTINTVE